MAFDGINLWVANNGSNTISCLRPRDGAVLATYSVGRSPFGVALDEVGSVWVANFSSNSVSTSRFIKSPATAR